MGGQRQQGPSSFPQGTPGNVWCCWEVVTIGDRAGYTTGILRVKAGDAEIVYSTRGSPHELESPGSSSARLGNPTPGV